MKAINCEIIEMIGTLGTRKGANGKIHTLDFNLMRLNGRPVYDLRWWCEGQPLTGLSLTERTLAEFGEMIDTVFEMEKKNEE